MKNYTESELMSMPLKIVRNLDFDTKEQETLIQTVVNRRLSVLPPSQAISRRDVPEIQNQEEEKEWQRIIDERTAKLRPSLMDIPAPTAMINPDADDFDPSKLDLADKTGEGESIVMGKIGAIKSSDGLTSTPGKPITLKGGVPSQLTRRPGRQAKKK